MRHALDIITLETRSQYRSDSALKAYAKERLDWLDENNIEYEIVGYYRSATNGIGSNTITIEIHSGEDSHEALLEACNKSIEWIKVAVSRIVVNSEADALAYTLRWM